MAWQESVIVTDLIAQSFIKIFNNAFLNTIERVRPVGMGMGTIGARKDT